MSAIAINHSEVMFCNLIPERVLEDTWGLIKRTTLLKKVIKTNKMEQNFKSIKKFTVIFIYGTFSCHLIFSEQAHQAFI